MGDDGGWRGVENDGGGKMKGEDDDGRGKMMMGDRGWRMMRAKDRKQEALGWVKREVAGYGLRRENGEGSSDGEEWFGG